MLLMLFLLMIMRQSVSLLSCYIRSKGVARHMPKIAGGTQKLIVLYDFLIDEGELGAAFKFGNLGLETDATGRQEPSTINQLQQYLQLLHLQTSSYPENEMARHISFTTVDAHRHGCRTRPLSAAIIATWQIPELGHHRVKPPPSVEGVASWDWT
jgi:hypothetical protein